MTDEHPGRVELLELPMRKAQKRLGLFLRVQPLLFSFRPQSQRSGDETHGVHNVLEPLKVVPNPRDRLPPRVDVAEPSAGADERPVQRQCLCSVDELQFDGGVSWSSSSGRAASSHSRGAGPARRTATASPGLAGTRAPSFERASNSSCGEVAGNPMRAESTTSGASGVGLPPATTSRDGPPRLAQRHAYSVLDLVTDRTKSTGNRQGIDLAQAGRAPDACK